MAASAVSTAAGQLVWPLVRRGLRPAGLDNGGDVAPLAGVPTGVPDRIPRWAYPRNIARDRDSVRSAAPLRIRSDDLACV